MQSTSLSPKVHFGGAGVMPLPQTKGFQMLVATGPWYISQMRDKTSSIIYTIIISRLKESRLISTTNYFVLEKMWHPTKAVREATELVSVPCRVNSFVLAPCPSLSPLFSFLPPPTLSPRLSLSFIRPHPWLALPLPFSHICAKPVKDSYCTSQCGSQY